MKDDFITTTSIPKVAILVDGGFYKKVALSLWGKKTGEERAHELLRYCIEHYKNKNLYRVFYYDCPPSDKRAYHPFLDKTVDLKKSETYEWAQTFLNKLKEFRKFALRLGYIAEASIVYSLSEKKQKELMRGQITVSDLVEEDFIFSAKQKGVDMRIGLDIASLAYKKLVDQIVLISGDSDFVPAAKLARREGIDFILDPMWQPIRDDLKEHIDGLQSKRISQKPFNREEENGSLNTKQPSNDKNCEFAITQN